jgi:hypothetical protein
MSDLSEALDVAGKNDLGAALEASRGIELSFQDLPSAKIEWYVNLEPVLGEFMEQEWNNTDIRVGDVEVLDSSPTRELLYGWNYGPASILLIDDNGVVGEVPPSRLFFIPGRGGRISAPAI